MDELRVELAERAYPILIGQALIDDPSHFASRIKGRAAVVTSDRIAPYFLDRLRATLARAQVDANEIILPDGEAAKTWETLNLVYSELLAQRCDRRTTLIALGGGVVGDITGFAAATYQRGVPFIQVPTTLLAQVDSSVGGKTAINHPLGKNMIGAFYQPILVLADTETLSTLPEREFRSGIAEVIKYGFIYDLAFLEWLEANLDALMRRDPVALTHAIRRSCEIKSEIVVQDERETGMRAWLNLGHTFGHAIEAGLGYGHWLHGEAVAAGMVLAAELSARLGFLASTDAKRIRDLVIQAGLPARAPDLGSACYLELMHVDKKAQGGAIRYVLLKRLGEACVEPVPDETVRALLEQLTRA